MTAPLGNVKETKITRRGNPFLLDFIPEVSYMPVSVIISTFIKENVKRPLGPAFFDGYTANQCSMQMLKVKPQGKLAGTTCSKQMLKPQYFYFLTELAMYLYFL